MEGQAIAASTPAPQVAAPANQTVPVNNSQPKAAPAQGVTSNKAETPSQTQAQKEAQKYWELKADGKQLKLSEEQMRAYASLGLAGQKRMEEAAHLRKQAESALGKLTKDPIQAALDAGVPLEQVRKTIESWYKQNIIDKEMMTPEQRELAELKAWKEQEEGRKKQEEEKIRLEAQEKEDLILRDQLQKEIIETIEKTGLPKTKFTASRIAFWKAQNLSRGFDAPEEVILQQVRSEAQGIIHSMTEAADGQALIDLLGENLINKIRKYDLERLKGKLGMQAQPVTPASSKKKEGPTSMRDVDKYFREIRMQKTPNRR